MSKAITLEQLELHALKGANYTDKKVNELREDVAGAIEGEMPTIVQEAGQSESYVMSQKAVTDLVEDAASSGNAPISYERVDSVAQMTDTSKAYLLSTTGTLWTCMEKTTVIEHNGYSASTAAFNKRLNSSGVEKDLGGALLLPMIEQTYDANCVVTIKGIDKLILNYSSLFQVDYYDASGARIKQLDSGNGNWLGSAPSELALPYSFNLFPSAITGLESTGKVRIKLGIATDGTSISAANCEGLVVNFNTKNTTQTSYEWTDTGITPSADGGNYVKLLVRTNENSTAINEIDRRVTALEAGDEALTIPTFWESAVSTCISKIKALQVGKNCVTFPFFSDNHTRNGYVGVLIAHIMKECHIPYAFFGGDAIASGYLVESEMIAQDAAFDAIMSYIPDGRFCRAVGNHDGFWNDNGSKHGYTREQVYELFLREESVWQNKHYGDDGTYYYVDDIASKVRFVILNTNPLVNVGAGSEVIDSAQLSWLQNTALKFNENGWGVVIISHCPVSNHYHANVTNAAEVIAAVNGSGTDIIGWYSGHIHRDRMYTHSAVGSTDGVEGTNGNPLGFTQVTITSDHTGIAYDDATKHTVTNDDKSHAIDFVTINRATRTVNITRLGMGNDRSYTY